ncbi:MAG: putative neutral zinc metallopeptidase [Verrucomicrobia bacterium ADurb.Bin474]|nr:MAG: putative neutral zinc metallopeptidase [Verrucomicrobia bacterium ADurb.Bin474]
MNLYFILLIGLPMILGMWAQMRVSSAYGKYSRIPSRSGISGREAAAYVLRRFGISDVSIVPIKGLLSDHYNPASKQLALSEKNYYGTSLAALGVSAHEAGHAIQHAVGYKALNFRMALVPITSFASQMLPFVIMGGFLFGIMGLIKLGILIYLILTVFQLVTLPVEFDASARAKRELAGLGIITQDEMPGVVSTLNAAAWTYVAAFVASLGNLLYLFAISRDD